jgi:hypothetical protein
MPRTIKQSRILFEKVSGGESVYMQRPVWTREIIFEAVEL